jgi:hypothetical protein
MKTNITYQELYKTFERATKISFLDIASITNTKWSQYTAHFFYTPIELVHGIGMDQSTGTFIIHTESLKSDYSFNFSPANKNIQHKNFVPLYWNDGYSQFYPAEYLQLFPLPQNLPQVPHPVLGYIIAHLSDTVDHMFQSPLRTHAAHIHPLS